MNPLASVTWRGQLFEVYPSGVSLDDAGSLFVVQVNNRPGPLLVHTGGRWDVRQSSHPAHPSSTEVPAALTRELDAWLRRRAA